MSDGRVLVTGAAGFIGGACAREFSSRGWDVTALVHRREPEGLSGARIIRASITERDQLISALCGEGPFDAVVHCAGRASDVGRDHEFRAANHQGVLNIIECMEPAGIRRLVHISTTDVYGIRDFVSAGEDTPFLNNLRNPYPKYKILAERDIAEKLPAERYVILRPAAVWGEGDTTLLPRILSFLRTSPFIFHFGKWRGRNRWPLAHVSNVARAAFLGASCNDALGQAYNVVDPEHTTIDEYYRMLIRACLPEKAGMRSVSVPFWVGWTIGVASSLLSNALNRPLPLFEPSLYGLYSVSRDLDFSGKRLQQLFATHGEEFVSRESGLRSIAPPDESVPA